MKTLPVVLALSLFASSWAYGDYSSTSKYEKLLMTKLRNKECPKEEYKTLTHKIAAILVNKVVEFLPTSTVTIETPVTSCVGEKLATDVELVSIMRSGDTILQTFVEHFPTAPISKILIQRDEHTLKPQFHYMKLSLTIASGNKVIITEPMIGTGGTLDMVIGLLKERGVQENNILIASVCAAPEGIARVNSKYPQVQIVTTVVDEKLTDKGWIYPGLGDFGDRYFGTK